MFFLPILLSNIIIIITFFFITFYKCKNLILHNIKNRLYLLLNNIYIHYYKR